MDNRRHIHGALGIARPGDGATAMNGQTLSRKAGNMSCLSARAILQKPQIPLYHFFNKCLEIGSASPS